MKNVSLFFDEHKCDIGDAAQVGNKAANLMSMMKMGLNVPEGFVLPAHLTFEMPDGGFPFDSDVMVRAKAVVRFAADHAGRDWSNHSDMPYLVSVRSGAAVSMPGMMDTILNIGLNSHNVKQVAKMLGDNAESHRFAFDCYRRLVQMYGTTVCGHDPVAYSSINEMAKEYFLIEDAEMMEVVADNSAIVFAELEGHEFPQNIDDQLCGAINAVFSSWTSDRAIAYRDHMGIAHDMGTAVTIQGMKFGNMNDRSATGVVFSRNPNTGEPGMYGDFLVNAQGEDVVSGTHNTHPIDHLEGLSDFESLYYDLYGIVTSLDKQHDAAVDVEFTIEDGKIWILQCRKGKLTTKASVRAIIDRLDLPTSDVDKIVSEILSLFKTSEPETKSKTPVATGQGVSAGIGTGVLCSTKKSVDAAKAKGTPYIFVATDTSPNDTPQMIGASGILTTNGSSTCHAAVVARSWDIPAVVGCPALHLSDNKDRIWLATLELAEGQVVATIDGDTGEVFFG